MNSLFLDYDPSLRHQQTHHDRPRDADELIEEELVIYKRMPTEFVTDKDIIPWWIKRSNELPLLYDLARFIFAIPASSAAVEASFSYAGLVTVDNRASLDPDTLENILILRSNSDLANSQLGEFE